MNEKLFIKTYYEESIINIENEYEDINLFGENYNSRFTNDDMIGNLFIANSKIMKNEADWEFADRVLQSARNWKRETVYHLDYTLISKKTDKYILVENLKNVKLQKLLEQISSSEYLETKCFATDLLVQIGKSLYLFVISQKVLIKIDEIEEDEKKQCCTIYFLVVPWRLMILYGEIGLRKTYIEIGEIFAYLEQNIINKYIYSETDLIFSEEEIKLGFTSVEKQIVKKIEILL